MPEARSAAIACSAATTPPFMSAEPRPCTAPPAMSPENGSRAHALRAGAHDVEVAVDAQPRRRRVAAGQGDGGADELGARGLLAGMAGIGPQRREVVLLQARVEAQLGRQRDELHRRGALLAGDAAHPHEAGDVARERRAVEARRGRRSAPRAARAVSR